ncbi:hypothetical protein [Psychrobacter sp. JCM 18900]|uniref:hypothetical protein n=1 Tax=Psychrobacter sp. JCM 18900 TaxID=1298608 RepID=UPI000430A8AC|nr:hypothetical protein [Psychrobacter sp. JCM 18900]GAF53124.1 hypothetical protein JCM18900_11682 [Psychrobacter sp. JCM 18900]
MNTIIVKVNNKVETVAEHTVVLKDETPTVIKAVNRTNYELLDTTVNRAPNNVVTKRVDKNLHISFENDGQGPDLIIEGFYDNADSALIGIAEDGSYYYYLPDTGDVTDYVTELQMGEAQSQSLAGDSQISPWWVGATEAEGFAALPWLLGLAGVGVAAAALGGGGGDDNDSAPVDTTAPDAPTDIYVGNDDAFINAAEIDDNGKVDVIIGLPDNASVGDIITVNGIKQKLTNDDIENKNVTVKINAPAEGEALDVTASITDAAGNESDELSETVGIVDTIAPGEQEDADPVAPVVALSDDEAGGVSASEFENGVQVNVTLPLGTVAGDTVTLTVTPDGGVPITVDYEVTEDDLDASIGNGVAIVTIQNNIEDGITADGDYSVTAVVTDVAGNSSMTSESVNFTVDTAPPGAPNIAIGNGDALITADEIRDSQVTISIGLPDNASVGDTVTVNGVDQQLTNNDIANSTATVTIDAPLEGQSLQVTASITDVAGNKSTAVTVSATRDTDDAPEAPDGVAIGNGDTFITADEIAGNQVDVIVDLPESSSVGYTVIVNGVEKVLTNDDIEAGNVGVEIPAPEEGAALEVSVKIEDTAGNVSPTVTANAVRDTTAPDTPLAAPVITDNVDGNGDPLDPAETIANQGITNDNTPGVVIPDSELANGTPTLLVDGVVVPAP